MKPASSPPAMAELTVREVMKEDVEADRASDAVLLCHLSFSRTSGKEVKTHDISRGL